MEKLLENKEEKLLENPVSEPESDFVGADISNSTFVDREDIIAKNQEALDKGYITEADLERLISWREKRAKLGQSYTNSAENTLPGSHEAVNENFKKKKTVLLPTPEEVLRLQKIHEASRGLLLEEAHKADVEIQKIEEHIKKAKEASALRRLRNLLKAPGTGTVSPESAKPIVEEIPASKKPEKVSFWKNAGNKVSSFFSNVFGTKEPEIKKEEPKPIYDELSAIKSRTSGKEADQAREVKQEIVLNEAISFLINSLEIPQKDFLKKNPFGDEEQGDIMEYLTNHPEVRRKKSVELLTMLDRFDEKRKEVLVASVLETLPGDHNNLLKTLQIGKGEFRHNGKVIPFKDFMRNALQGVSENHYFETMMPYGAEEGVMPFSEIEQIVKKITSSDYLLETPKGFSDYIKALFAGQKKKETKTQ